MLILPFAVTLSVSFLFLYLIENFFKNFFLSFILIKHSKYKIGYSSNKFISPLHIIILSEIEIFFV